MRRLGWLLLFLALPVHAEELVPIGKGPATVTRTVGRIPWTPYGDVAEGKTLLADLVSHCRNASVYSDRNVVTCAHETTHGINGELRQRFGHGYYRYDVSGGWTWTTRRSNAFYLGRGRAILLPEPNLSLRAVAERVPGSLRGRGYSLYLSQQLAAWNDRPLYVLDEWVSYVNGSLVREEQGLQDRADAVGSASEFLGYAWVLAWVSTEAGYRSNEFQAFLLWQSERTVRLAQNVQEAKAWLSRLRTAKDAEPLRAFIRDYAGAEWAATTLGIGG